MQRAGRPGQFLELDFSFLGESLAGLSLDGAKALGQVVHQLVVGPEAVAGELGVDLLQAVEREEDVGGAVALTLQSGQQVDGLGGKGNRSLGVGLGGPFQDAKLAALRDEERAWALGCDADRAAVEVDVLPEEIQELALSKPAADGKPEECLPPEV
ncbi:MAG: hypothetical protein R3B46_05760 [Phycisphaerales bacterium]